MTLAMNNDSGYSVPKSDKREMRSSNQRMSPYYFLTTASHSSSGSSHSPPVSVHNLYHAPPNYYYPAPDYPKDMWHRNRYKEDELPNMSSNMAAALYPRMQVGPNPQLQLPPNRRYSVASVSQGSNVNFGQRRRISVTKYQNIPPGNYLQVPTFHDYDVQPTYSAHIPQHLEIPSHHEYMEYNSQNSPPGNSRRSSNESQSRRKSTGCIPKTTNSRHSKSQSRESRSRSQSPVKEKSSKTPPRSRTRSPSLERIGTPDITASTVPVFEFNSSHLPLRPPTINIKQFSSGSGSTSTPESQRIESRQMIRPSSSKTPYSVSGDPRKDNKKDATGLWSITRPAKWCRHTKGKTCQTCTVKLDAASQCSSINPPPTFTAIDIYQTARKRSKSCTCSAIFSVTVMLGVLVMLFIAAFILYVELVLKHQTDNVIDKM